MIADSEVIKNMLAEQIRKKDVDVKSRKCKGEYWKGEHDKGFPLFEYLREGCTMEVVL